MGISGKVAIVTGSSSGIGKATAVLLAKKGAKVTITGRNKKNLQGTKKAILAAGASEDDINIVVGDITEEDSQDDIVISTLKKFGKIDILINNAGASIPDKNGKVGVAQSVVTYKKVFDLNVKSLIEMTQKCRPYLAKTKGEIVNVSSLVSGNHAFPECPYYAAAKAAVDQYTRSCAIDFIPEGIRVNAVNPGVVATGFGKAMGLDDSEKFYKELGSSSVAIPRGFAGKPEHIARLIVFLADRFQSTYLIGQTLQADGGSALVMGLHAHMELQNINFQE